MIKIALIDHQVLMRKGLALMINGFNNCSVTLEANHGQHFISLLQQHKHPPDLVILDIHLPVMDGFETALWISQNLPETKIITLTREQDERSIITMLQHGAKAYMLKNIEPDEFNKALLDVYTKGMYINDILYKNLVHTQHNGAAETQDAYLQLMNLPEREKDFLKWVCTEKTLKQIAVEMHVSPRTIDGYRDQLFEKIKVSSRIGLVLFAIKNQLVKL
jgi:two-component system invasion response regulator UvrY